MAITELKTDTLSAFTVNTAGANVLGGNLVVSDTGGIVVTGSGGVTTTGLIVNNFAQVSGDLSVTGTTPFRKVRAVITANVSNLAAFNVSINTDGVVLVANDIVLLTAQTTAAQNGPYVVGTVAAGVAPLTRPAWFPASGTVPTGFALEVGGEGNTFKNTTWKAMRAANSFVVDASDGEFYPLIVSGSAVLSSGTATITSVPLRSTTSNVVITRIGAGSSASSTIMYVLSAAPTAGPVGTATFTIRSALSSGSVNTSDTSTLRWTVINQP